MVVDSYHSLTVHETVESLNPFIEWLEEVQY